MRQTAWNQKVQKQATRALFLANYLLKNKPEDPAIEKLLKNLNGSSNTSTSEPSDINN